MQLPKAKTDKYVFQEVNKEILLYNLDTHQAFCLNETISKIYSACDGKTNFDELKTNHNLTDDLIYLSLDELIKKDLVEKSDNYVSRLNGLTRREAAKKIGLASTITLPIIYNLIAPTPFQAATGCSPSGSTVRLTVNVAGTPGCRLCDQNIGSLCCSRRFNNLLCPVGGAPKTCTATCL